MCGRYATTSSRADLARVFDVDLQHADPELPADYNVAPTKQSMVVLARPPRDAGARAEPVRQIRDLVWGLVPSWSKDPKPGARMINARAETVAEKPAYRRAFVSRRLLVPVAGFYEWLPTQQLGRAGKPLKQPFYLRPRGSDVLPVAGIYEFWRDREKASDEPGAWLTTFAIITTTATDDVGRIHDRMPMTVPQENWDAWLDPRHTATAELQELMQPPAEGSLDIYAVSTEVNSVRNSGAELVRPLHEVT